MMQTERRTLLTALLGGVTMSTVSATSTAAEEVSLPPPEDVMLWPDGAIVLPKTEGVADPSVPNLVPKAQLPLMTVYRPAKPDGSALIMCPGGGYLIVGRGPGVPTWFAKRGVTVFDLKYRLPGVGFEAGPDAPLQDAQRAMRLIRKDAAIYGVDPARIGVIGFSSGGHVASMLATAYGDETAANPTPEDKSSARPDFAILACPVITMVKPYAHGSSFRQLFGKEATPERVARYSAEQRVTKDTPPTFLVHANDDRTVPLENSLMMLQALRKAGVSAEFHAFQSGGHNMGPAFTPGSPLSAFPQLILDWMARNKWSAA
jgi:acetyl esterase/lipase